ncbi:MAG: dihydrofolate reductase family protein [Patescibacteria group bacterium]
MTNRPVSIISTTSIDGKIRGFGEDDRLSDIYPMPQSVLIEIHKLRAKFDGIMVGANTVRLDNPSLTVRYVESKKKPWRITVSRKSEFDLRSNIFNDEATSLLITTSQAPQEKLQQLEKKGVKTLILGKREVDLKTAIKSLGKLHIKRIMVEGGPTLISSLINEDLVQELILITYPIVLGNNSVPSLITDLKLKSAIKTKLYDNYSKDGFAFRFYKFV